MEPKGTRPISTLRPDSRSHRSDPMPTPTENTASRTVTVISEPCSTLFAKSGSCERKSAP